MSMIGLVAIESLEHEQQLSPQRILQIAMESVGVCESAKETKIILVLSEPDPGNSAVWIRWFDGLVSCKEVVDGVIVSQP